jgi:hypothetical protein
LLERLRPGAGYNNHQFGSWTVSDNLPRHSGVGIRGDF